MFYTCTIGLVCSSVFLVVEAIYNNSIRMHTWQTYGLLTLAAAVDICAESFAVVAFQHETAGFVAMVGQMIVVYAFAADLLFFQEVMTGY